MIVQAAGGGYTDSVIIEVTVSAPTVTVTSPSNGSVYQVGASLNVSASASATCGSLSLSSLTISEGGTSIGTIDYPLTEGEPTAFPWTVVVGANVFTATAVYGSGAGEVSVTSVPVTATGGSVTVPDVLSGWAPDPGYVGDIVEGPATGVINGGIDSDGSRPMFVVCDWEPYTGGSSTAGVWESAGDIDPFNPYTGGSGTLFSELKPAVGSDVTDFYRFFESPGFYFVGVECTATVYSSATGGQVGSVHGDGYVGGHATDVATLTSRAEYYRPSLGPTSEPLVKARPMGSSSNGGGGSGPSLVGSAIPIKGTYIGVYAWPGGAGAGGHVSIYISSSVGNSGSWYGYYPNAQMHEADTGPGYVRFNDNPPTGASGEVLRE